MIPNKSLVLEINEEIQGVNKYSYRYVQTCFSIKLKSKTTMFSLLFLFLLFLNRNKEWKFESHFRAVFQFVSVQTAATSSATVLPVFGGATAASPFTSS